MKSGPSVLTLAASISIMTRQSDYEAYKHHEAEGNKFAAQGAPGFAYAHYQKAHELRLAFDQKYYNGVTDQGHSDAEYYLQCATEAQNKAWELKQAQGGSGRNEYQHVSQVPCEPFRMSRLRDSFQG